MTHTDAQREQCRQDTLAHILKVQQRMAACVSQLEQRARAHDQSKLEEPELGGYTGLTANLATIRYGSPAYRQALVDAAPTIAHHYAENDHHPEHHPNGVAGMSLLALLEMVCDWKAASERMQDGSIGQSLQVNAARFGLSPQLLGVIQATIDEQGW